MVRSRGGLALAIVLVAAVLTVASSSLLSGVVPSFAVQDPRISFDMLPDGNLYIRTPPASPKPLDHQTTRGSLNQAISAGLLLRTAQQIRRMKTATV